MPPRFNDGDFLGLDDVQAFRLPEHQRAGTSRSTPAGSDVTLVDGPSGSYEMRRAILESQKEAFERQLLELQEKIAQVEAQLEVLEDETDDGPLVDYTSSNFPWSHKLKQKMRSVFGIEQFRFCQQGVCNANMAGRDIVCVMPTGGGKSLTYQLPAIIQDGVTLVISPLISLITDQVIHLEEAGVQAVRLTSANSQSENDRGMKRLRAMAESTSQSRGDDIKLVYVTPEKVVQSPTFRSLLQRLAEGNKLERIVIDEAHCVSQMGHDFRPDYAKLHILRQLLPRVPIMAVSATCPPKVLQDLLSILRLRKPVDGDRAPRRGTIYFKSPLYRPNLHYTVYPKPATGDMLLQAIHDFIVTKHLDDSGIIYCLSKKNAEMVAKKLRDMSGGKIKTGVYHAERKAPEKEVLHRAWREGKVKVVCATIAFGLGIDKGDVRFVIHHTMSKSVDGFYQESGRAGRDGKDAECILYFQPADFSTLCTLVHRDQQGITKALEMLKFAQNFDNCRKVQFARYFQHASAVEISSWGTDNSDALSRCGHCDNCARKGGVFKRDITLQVWQLLKLVHCMERHGVRPTFRQLASFATGHKVAFGAKHGSKDRGTTLDLNSICEGPLQVSVTDAEYIIGQLLLEEQLKLEFRETPYATIVYIRLNEKGRKYADLSQAGVLSQANLKMYLTLRLPTPNSPSSKGKKRKSTASSSGTSKKVRVTEDQTSVDEEEEDIDMDGPSHHTRGARASTKGKGKAKAPPESEDEVEILSSPIFSKTKPAATKSQGAGKGKGKAKKRDEWSYSMNDNIDSDEGEVSRPSRSTRNSNSFSSAGNVVYEISDTE